MNKIEELERILGQFHYTWEHFEANECGEIKIKDPMWGENTFKMRIGLHMGRPTQAIMAIGSFVKLRAAPKYGQYVLAKLDPQYPDDCLYPHPGRVGRELTQWMYLPYARQPDQNAQSQGLGGAYVGYQNNLAIQNTQAQAQAQMQMAKMMHAQQLAQAQYQSIKQQAPQVQKTIAPSNTTKSKWFSRW